MRIYVASSWRNQHSLNEVVAALRAEGHDVYDFREDEAFDWADVDPGWTRENGVREPAFIHQMLAHPVSQRGYKRDMDALLDCQALVLVMPCGRSAHLELGVAIGEAKLTVVYLSEPCEPELMWNAADSVARSLAEVVEAFA